MDRGQPLLLPPGMHYWESDTITFQKNIDLSEPVINMGPYTLVTVDEGYSAVTQNNGRMVCLRGGQVYLLTHRNWKFEKFMSEKVQTDDIPMQTMSTADNVLLTVSATVTWMIKDVETAARCAADTMYTGTSANDVSMPTLRNDVVKQALASLSAFIGSVRYSESFGISTAASTLHNPPTAPVEPEAEAGCRGLFDDEARKHLQTAVDHCNEVTIRYGVVVTSVNIISAMPKDDQLFGSSLRQPWPQQRPNAWRSRLPARRRPRPLRRARTPMRRASAHVVRRTPRTPSGRATLRWRWSASVASETRSVTSPPCSSAQAPEMSTNS